MSATSPPPRGPWGTVGAPRRCGGGHGRAGGCGKADGDRRRTGRRWLRRRGAGCDSGGRLLAAGGGHLAAHLPATTVGTDDGASQHVFGEVWPAVVGGDGAAPGAVDVTPVVPDGAEGGGAAGQARREGSATWRRRVGRQVRGGGLSTPGGGGSPSRSVTAVAAASLSSRGYRLVVVGRLGIVRAW